MDPPQLEWQSCRTVNLFGNEITGFTSDESLDIDFCRVLSDQDEFDFPGDGFFEYTLPTGDVSTDWNIQA